MVKEYPKPKEEPQTFFKTLELLPLLEVCDPGLPDLCQLVHRLVGPQGAQKWIQEARCHNLMVDIQGPSSSTSQRSEESSQNSS